MAAGATITCDAVKAQAAPAAIVEVPAMSPPLVDLKAYDDLLAEAAS